MLYIFHNILSECWMQKLNVKKRAVMRSYLDLEINAYTADVNFNYTECGMAKLLQEYCKWNPW